MKTLTWIDTAVCLGNGQSRQGLDLTKMKDYATVIGCNAIYRDGPNVVHNLVAVDYGMQQEIYDSGWCDENPEFGDIHNVDFENWQPVPADIADLMFMGYDIPEEFIHRSKNRTSECAIQGKDPQTVQQKLEIAMRMNPGLDAKDLRLKMEKDVGIWITYVNDMNEIGIRDVVCPIDFPRGWSTGNTALHLACQAEPKEVYVLGFDLSSYDEPLNNLYKGTLNYLPADTKGFNSQNWFNQMFTIIKEFKEITFYLVDPINFPLWQYNANSAMPNVISMTKEGFCEELKIV